MAAKDYKIFDGTNWVSPCDQEIRLLKPDGTWQLIDPNTDDVKYFDGVNWKPMECQAVIDCSTSSLSGSGGAGIYYIPMMVGANVCDLSVTFNIISVPDSLTILSEDRSTILKQTGYFGVSPVPALGSYLFGPTETRKIYNYSPGAPGNFTLDPLAPNETLTVIANEFPIVDTNPLNIPNSFDPSNPTQNLRTIVWNKGITGSDVKVWIRVVGYPGGSTGWSITALTCINCT